MSQIKRRLVLAHWMVHQLGFSDYETGFTTLGPCHGVKIAGWTVSSSGKEATNRPAIGAAKWARRRPAAVA